MMPVIASAAKAEGGRTGRSVEDSSVPSGVEVLTVTVALPGWPAARSPARAKPSRSGPTVSTPGFAVRPMLPAVATSNFNDASRAVVLNAVIAIEIESPGLRNRGSAAVTT